MGAADVVPGVSGGTVALILGIYQRLVTAISHFDLIALNHVRHGRWMAAARHLDLRFLVSLACGIAGGFLIMTLLMNRLLTSFYTRSLTLSVFFGMIVASAVLVACMVRMRSLGGWLTAAALGLAGAALAYWSTTLAGGGDSDMAPPSLGYLFFCGSLAICAMILPGISGAMVLLILGVYLHLTEIPHNILHGERLGEAFATIGVFGAGCAISLILFSKLLRWLLVRYEAPTMALLCGFMFGALPKLWPFQRDITPEIAKFKHKQFELVFPDAWNMQELSVVAAALLAAAAVFAVEYVTRTAARVRHPEEIAPEEPVRVSN